MSVEDRARDIVATPAHKRTEVPPKTALAKEKSKSPPQYRREAEDDKFIMPTQPPSPGVLITDTPSPVNDHEYCTNCKKFGHMTIMCTFHVKKTGRIYGHPSHNIITCGRPPKKAVRPQNLKPLPEDTSPILCISLLHLIHKVRVEMFALHPYLITF